MNNCFVYQHIRLDTNQVFYIGIGRSYPYKKRARVSTSLYRNELWHKIVNEHGHRWEIVFDNLTQDEARAKEVELILKYGRISDGTGILCNIARGGLGNWDYKHTNETKNKLRESVLKQNREGNNPRLGCKHSDKSKSIMRLRKLGIKHSEEQNEHQSKARSTGTYKIYKDNNLLGSFHSTSIAFKSTGVPPRSISQLASNNKIGRWGKAKGIMVEFTPNNKIDKKTEK